MSLFWIAAGLLAAAACVLVLRRAARTPVAEVRPEVEVHRRQLAELDDLRSRGLLDDAGYAAARAEAGRRLLRADDETEGDGERAAPTAFERRATLVAVAAVALAALGLYLVVGSPGTPDQPYAARVAAWRTKDPATLDPARLAAVMEDVARERPSDPQVWLFLGRARGAAEDMLGAERAFRRAVELAPGSADAWVALGEARVALNDDRVGPDARASFQEALRLAPDAPPARYWLGRADIDAGRTEAGLQAWRALAESLPAGDPNRAGVEAEIARVRAGGSDASAAVANAPPAEQGQMIRGMVAGLAARLEASPDDPQGWARLVRAYTVLGDTAARDRALARARKLFVGRPQDLAAVEAAAR